MTDSYYDSLSNEGKADVEDILRRLRGTTAREFLYEKYREWGKKYRDYPREMVVSRALYAAYDEELSLHERFTSQMADGSMHYGLMFKNAVLRPGKVDEGWVVESIR